MSDNERALNSILRKQRTYEAQMAPVVSRVLRHLQPRGWRKLPRGRSANASVYGPVGIFNGVIDIELVETDWDRKPETPQCDTRFHLWSAASVTRNGTRLHADAELFWETSFVNLLDVVDQFVPMAWTMLSGLGEENLLPHWPGPAVSPDRGPDFGPPRTRSRT